MAPQAFDLRLPAKRTSSVIFASPHSGRAYSDDFLAQSLLNEHRIRSSEDAFVDVLFSAAPSHGMPFLVAEAPRAFVDLNRAADELDPALIVGLRRSAHNPRVASGLGVIPRVVAGGRPIYSGKISLAEAQDRLANYWRPYHDTLRALIDQSHKEFGEAILIDCHSMPHEAIDAIGQPGRRRPEVVLGDRFGAAAGVHIVEAVESILAAAGLKVVRNMPFAGAHITQAYGRPSARQHVVQIEIDRALYMNERTLELSENFEPLQKLLSGIIAEIGQIGRPAASVAAE